MRIADLVRQFIIDNIAIGYSGASIWREDQYPFNNPNDNIILTRQNGRAVDAMIREIDVDITIFSKTNATGADHDAIYTVGESILEYLKSNFIVNQDLKFTITQDLTGPYRTSQDRYYYTISLLTYSE